MVGINKKPEMSEFEKGVVHGMSLAKTKVAEEQRPDDEIFNPYGDRSEEQVELTKEDFDVVDWEHNLEKQLLGKEMNPKTGIKFHALCGFIKTLLEAKDTEITEAYSKGYLDGVNSHGTTQR